MGTLDGRPRSCCCGLVDPEVPFFQFWDIFMIVLLLFTSIVTPFEVAFLNAESVDTLFVINRLVDLGFFMDMTFQFRMPFKTASRATANSSQEVMVWVVDRKRIAKRYIQSWFLIDLISILPFDTLGLIDPSIKKLSVFRILRVIRLVKLMRAQKIVGIVEKYQVQMNISFAVTKLVKFIVYVVIICHWMACVWRLIPVLEMKHDTPHPSDGNWINKVRQQNSLFPPVILGAILRGA